MTKDQWEQLGTELFGADKTKWRFVCPACGHVQSVEDFRQYKDAGADPNSAMTECIGRYSGGRDAFRGKGPGPCNYAGYGLFRLGPILVVADGAEIQAFDFDHAPTAPTATPEEPTR